MNKALFPQIQNLTFFTDIWSKFIQTFYDNGGWKSKTNLTCTLLFLWATHAFLREKGCLPKKSVKGKHVFITGSGSGLGQQLAIKFAKLGAKVSVSDIRMDGVQETRRLIKQAIKDDSNVFTAELDVCNRQMITQVIQKAQGQLGDVDILINNAGVVQGKPFTELNEKFVSKTMIINAECHFWLIKDVIGSMIKRNSGHIVSVSSVAGLAGNPGMTDYCASKFAALGLNESLRLEMKQLKHDIKFTTICPFYFNSGLFEGVKCSLVYPLLETDYVANRTVNAILQNEGEVSIPWSMGCLIHFCKAVFTSSVVDFLAWILVGYESILGNFKGRSGVSNTLTIQQKKL